jgi:hypothetical protein
MLRLLVVALTLLLVRPAAAVEIIVGYEDGPTEGFNDPTFGSARKAAFQHALQLWGSWLGGMVPVQVRAKMDPLGGSSAGATLGYCGPDALWRDFPNAPLANTWYTTALANQIAGYDLEPDSLDFHMTLNSDIDGDVVLGARKWYYGTDGQAGMHFDFVSVVLHEFGHGLGFLTMTRKDGTLFQDAPDVYATQLLQPGVGPLIDMTVEQRAAALVSDNLLWAGSAVQAKYGAPAPVFAPTDYRWGSSISHWDTSHTPHELMEPYYMGPNHDPGLAREAFLDIGWHAVGVPLPPGLLKLQLEALLPLLPESRLAGELLLLREKLDGRTRDASSSVR